ncbi:MAG: hypothetical protein WD016_07405 [Balneolaceae bacterium]
MGHLNFNTAEPLASQRILISINTNEVNRISPMDIADIQLDYFTSTSISFQQDELMEARRANLNLFVESVRDDISSRQIFIEGLEM